MKAVSYLSCKTFVVSSCVQYPDIEKIKERKIMVREISKSMGIWENSMKSLKRKITIIRSGYKGKFDENGGNGGVIRETARIYFSSEQLFSDFGACSCMNTENDLQVATSLNSKLTLVARVAV